MTVDNELPFFYLQRNISYCMFSAYKRGLSSKMDKKAQVIPREIGDWLYADVFSLCLLTLRQALY